MQTLPTGWPTGDDIIAPEIYAGFASAAWPPAMEDAPAGTGIVGSWQVTRQLTGALLPGQVRSASGFSIATGSVDLPQPTGAPLSPWSKLTGVTLAPGGGCVLYATYGGPAAAAAERVRLGNFVVAPIAGTTTGPSYSLELDEDSARLKRPVKIDWRYHPADQVEAAWVLDRIARAGGYYATPPTVTSSILHLPLCGSILPDKGTLSAPLTVPAWVTVDGGIGLGSGETVTASATSAPQSLHVTVDHNGSGTVTLGVPGYSGLSVTVTASSVSFGGASVAISGPVAGWRRVQLRLTNTAGSLERSARVDGGAWVSAGSAAATHNAEYLTASVATTGGAAVRGVQWHTADDAALLTAPTARIAPTGSILAGVFNTSEQSGWDMAQGIAKSTMGAVWISEDGVFTYRDRDAMRGVGAVVETLETLDDLEDLPWRVDPADVADRVEVTYTPTEVVQVTTGIDSITIWEATEPVRVGAGQTVSLTADITGTTDRLSGFVPIWGWTDPELPVWPDGRASRWGAAVSPDGGGTRPADNAISITTQIIGASQVRIRITNRSASTLWMVDGTGSPCLILRTSLHVAPGEQVTLSAGATVDNAVLPPLQLDLGAWVQDATTAQDVLAWTLAQTTRAQATVDQVRVKPNLARQLGDVVRLTDEPTGLRTKAIVTGVSLDGGPGGYTQNLDLALLGVLFADFDAFCIANGLNTFADLDAWCIANGINTFAQLDAWLTDLGGAL